jgi:ubiquitin C-terminal hydrolase
MQFEKYKNKGLSGLGNLGNTCFINACMQIISHTYELNDFLDNGFKKKLNESKKYDSILLIEWNNLRKLLWSENCQITPSKFINTVQKTAKIKKYTLFTDFSQNDLPEFLLFIINVFHNALSREIKITITGKPENERDEMAIKCFGMIRDMCSKDYSEIWNLFYGVHVSEIFLENNTRLSVNPEPYFMIDLPIPEKKNPSLIDCFDLFVKGEILEGENAWFDETTKTKQNIQKKMSFWSFPDILVIDLKRFNNKMKKNQILISFPTDELNLSKYVIGYKKESYIYDLYGVVNHEGSTLGGHYTSFVKNANNKWYCFNDMSVTEVNEDKIVSPKAYSLFFRKRKNIV